LSHVYIEQIETSHADHDIAIYIYMSLWKWWFEWALYIVL